MAQKTWFLKNWKRRVAKETVESKTILIIFVKNTKAKGGLRIKKANKIEKNIRFFHHSKQFICEILIKNKKDIWRSEG